MQDVDTGAALNDGLTEALASIPPEPAPAAEERAEGGSDGGPARDEHGRFAAKAEAEAEAKPDERKPDGEDRDGGQIPSWRLREIREERDRIAAAHEVDRRKLETLERERAQWLQRQQQMREAEQAPQPPNPLVDPEGYDQFLRDQVGSGVKSVRQAAREDFVNLTFDLAVDQHGQEAVDAAMQALEGAQDPQAADKIAKAKNPAKALMDWHRGHKARLEVGDDIDGYNAKLRAKLKADPEFRKEFMAELDAEARGNSPARSSDSPTNLVSLNRAPGGGGRQQLGDLGSSDKEIFENLTRKRG